MMNRLKTRLKSIPTLCSAAAGQAIEETVSAARAEAQSMAPVRTGRLRRSIRSESNGLSGAVFANCDYAPFIELGGRGSPTRPFLYPAAQLQRQAFVHRTAQAFQEIMKGGS